MADEDFLRLAAEDAELKRARERLTLKHRNSSQWARRALKRGLTVMDQGAPDQAVSKSCDICAGYHCKSQERLKGCALACGLKKRERALVVGSLGGGAAMLSGLCTATPCTVRVQARARRWRSSCAWGRSCAARWSARPRARTAPPTPRTHQTRPATSTARALVPPCSPRVAVAARSLRASGPPRWTCCKVGV